MKTLAKDFRMVWIAAVAAALLSTGCSMAGMKDSDTAAATSGASLTGAQEVPPTPTRASGKSTITVGSDKTVTGEVSISGVNATAAHIHEGAKGVNGPVIVPLAKSSDTTFTVPPNTQLTDSQYANYVAGNLYVNVHSAAHPGGEIRTQLSAK